VTGADKGAKPDRIVTEAGKGREPTAGRPSGRVQTVLGPIDPGDLGWVLPHEHTAIALWHIPNRWDYWELRRDEPVILEELAAFRAAGGGTLVDVTLDGVGRDPEWLAGLSRSAGLRIVMGGGWYRGAHYPAEAMIDGRSVDALADVIVGDATDGVAGTGIRIGIIGEIGTDKPWLSAQEERVHRAAARASRRTGLAITTHAVQSTVGLDQLDVFEAEGADLARVVIGHADSNPSPAYHRAIVERGATVEFDFLGMSFTPLERHGEGRIVDSLRELLAGGHVERILLSQDVCHDSQLRRYGGNGYTYLADTFLPRLRAAGVSDDEIHTITVDNPRRLLTIA
jgi:predicted metal-dependent phosphotriesterase family hydrolase